MGRIPARVGIIAAALTAVVPIAGAQPVGRGVELVGTVQFVTGLTPLTTATGRHVLGHVGARIEGGLQISATSLVLGIRGWEVRDTSYDAHGADIFLALSRRLSGSNRTAIRASLSAGSDRLATRQTDGNSRAYHDGSAFSVGIEHELPLWTERMVVSADLLFPSVDDNPFHRGSPVLEFGIGLRARHVQTIGPVLRARAR